MIDNLAFILYSHSSLEWILNAFIDRQKTHFDINCNKYLFIDKEVDIDKNDYKFIQYDNSEKYTNRLLNCLNKVKEEFILIHHEDMLFYDDVDLDFFNYYFQILSQNDEFSYLKLLRGGVSNSNPYLFANGVYYLQDDEIYKFAIQPTIWKKENLIKLLELFKDMSIYDTENQISKYMAENNYKCLFAWNQEDSKKGLYHWDNNKYPFIATALSKGKWNTAEYEIEIENIKLEYNLK